MALTLNDNWRAAVNTSGSEIRFYVNIENGVAQAVDGDRRAFPGQFAKDHGIVRVDPISIAVDPLTRRMQLSSVTVTCFDKWIRPFAVANRLKGRKIEIQIGERDLAIIDFEPYFLGVIEEVRPVPGGNLVELECLDVLSFLRRKKIIGYWVSEHPLDVITDILSKADIPSSLINAASLDPANHPTIGHLVVGRSQITAGDDDATVRTPTSGFGLVDELLQIMNGGLLPDENGVLTFTLFDPTAAAVATWDDDVIGDFEQDVSDQNAINRVSTKMMGYPQTEDNGTAVNVETGRISHGGSTYRQIYQSNDLTSQAALAYPGEAKRVLETVIEINWVSQYYRPFHDLDSSQTDVALIGTGGSLLADLTGTRGMTSPPQPAEAVVSGSRLAWIYVAGEIMKVTAMTVRLSALGDPLKAFFVEAEDPETGSDVSIEVPIIVDLTVVRGQKGTAAVGHDTLSTASRRIVDITIPVLMADALLARFALGAHVVNITTSLLEYDKQLGDLILLDHRNFLGFGFDGVTVGAGKWEIIGKEVDVYNDPPEIRWKLMFIPGYTVSENARSWSSWHRQSEQNNQLHESEGAGLTQGWIISGFDITDAGGTTIDISPGLAKIGMNVVEHTSIMQITLPINADVYVYIGGIVGGVIPLAVANGLAAPERPPGSIFLGKVVTGAATITSITQDKTPGANNVPINPLNGNRIQSNTLGTRSQNTDTMMHQSPSQAPNWDFGSFTDESQDFFGT